MQPVTRGRSKGDRELASLRPTTVPFYLYK